MSFVNLPPSRELTQVAILDELVLFASREGFGSMELLYSPDLAATVEAIFHSPQTTQTKFDKGGGRIVMSVQPAWPDNQWRLVPLEDR